MSWVRNRFFDALLKLIAIVASVLIVNMIINLVNGNGFGLAITGMWSMFTTFNVVNYLIMFAISIGLYALIYLTLTKNTRDYHN